MLFNKKFKDSVFTSLFHSPDMLRRLYCALKGVSLPPETPVSINTLKNVLVMNQYNDISFEIGGRLVVLVEHQSTINPNMALRMLLYLAEILKRRFKDKTVYSDKSVAIPWLEFFVLYNGTKPFPEEARYRLSELFHKPRDLGLPEPIRPYLDLEVKVLNINAGKNGAIAERCRELAEYSLFIEKVNELIRLYGDRKKAAREAVFYCQNHDILKAYLEKHGREVINMLYTKFNLKDAKEVWCEEAEERGREMEKLVIARNLLEKGSTPEFVCEITGLSLEEIEKL